jgi:hypothetical protein
MGALETALLVWDDHDIDQANRNESWRIKPVACNGMVRGMKPPCAFHCLNPFDKG